MSVGGPSPNSSAQVLKDRLGLRVARVGPSKLRYRAWWSDVRPLVVIALALAASVLGYIGFRHSPATENGGVLDALYRTIRLFGLTAGDIDPPIAWELQIARVLAPLLVGYAAIRGLALIFREQVLLLRLRLFARRHVVVAGLGEKGFRLITALRDEGIAVVGVERSASNPNVAGCNARSIPVVIGDARDPAILRRARCDRAAHAVALCGRDGRNLDVLAACTELAEIPGWLPAWVHAEIEDPALWRLLRISALTTRSDENLRVEFFSVTDLVARAFVSAAFEAQPVEREVGQIVVSGSGPLARAIANHAVRVAGASQVNGRIALVFVGPTAQIEADALLNEASAITEVASVVAYDSEPLDGHISPELAAELQGSVVLVNADEDSIALARAAALAGAAGADRGHEVFAAVGSKAFDSSLAAAKIQPPGVRTIEINSKVFGSSLLFDTALEAIAQAKHEDYVRRELKRGASPSETASLQQWGDLQESLRESNRRFADGVGQKIGELGGALMPRQPGASARDELELPSATMEELAEDEHRRWVEDLRDLGWQYTDGPKDPDRKLHPLLVPWEELEEPEREKDRDGIRALPSLLAAAGYSLVLPQSQGAP